MAILSSHEFLTSASFATAGSPLSIPGGITPMSKIGIATFGTPSSKTLLFEGQGDVGAYVPILATNVSTGTTASQTTATTDEIWTISPAGLRNIRCRLSAISGSCTAKGILVV